MNWYKNLKYKLRKEHRNVVKAAWNSSGYNGYYLLDLEQAKLQEMKAYLLRNHPYSWSENIRYINICINLIDIINEKIDMIDFDSFRYHPVLCSTEIIANLRHQKNFIFLTRKVNTRNIKSWIPDADDSMIEIYQKYPEEFYRKKAEILYYKIRLEKTETWWD